MGNKDSLVSVVERKSKKSKSISVEAVSVQNVKGSDRMKKIAITGTIGSGKSEVSRLLREKGYAVFDCDQVSYDLSQPNQAGYNQIIKRFEGIVMENQMLDRKKLASIIFNDAQAKMDLQNILYPLILEEMEKQIKKSDTLFFAEVPTLYESGWEIYFDQVLVVSVCKEVRDFRLKQNRSMSSAQIEERVQAQISDEKKCALADWVIENNGTKEELKIKIEKWLEKVERN